MKRLMYVCLTENLLKKKLKNMRSLAIPMLGSLTLKYWSWNLPILNWLKLALIFRGGTIGNIILKIKIEKLMRIYQLNMNVLNVVINGNSYFYLCRLWR